MTYNYHTHTRRCGHAKGTEEEYVLRAIQGGIRHMGFSDHMPLLCDDGYESRYRVPMAEAKDYIADIIALREKYRDMIDIKVGFEMEYYPEEFEKMLQCAIDLGAEYLILGQHYPNNEHSGIPPFIRPSDSKERLKAFVSRVIAAIESGVFTYVAHPDFVNFTGDRETYQTEMRKICIAAKERNVPLEINLLGIHEGRNYPNPLFWELAGEVQAPVVFGFDAHDVARAFDEASLVIAKQMVQSYRLNYIGRPKLIPLG